MNRNKEFITNTIILFIGKFATQFMSLLLLPLFTRYLLTEDYGLVDLYQTYITLFVPILTLRLDSALFRFLVDKRSNEKETNKILSNIIIVMIICTFLTILLSFFIFYVIRLKYIKLVIINLVVLMISNNVLQILRGIGKTKEYSIASIITGIIILFMNILLIVFFKCGADSILISSSIANLFCILYVIIKTNLLKRIKIKLIEKKLIMEILKYTLPMIPNTLSWWIVNVSDRTIISRFLGIAYNGIYTVSCKFSNILNGIYSIFNMSWQETAILHINDVDKEKFFSSMINQLFMFFASMSLLIVISLPFVFNILVGKRYITSYSYIPLLLYADIWNVLTNLIGGIYVAKKKTREIANTTIISAIINLATHFLLIKFIGLYAACFSTLIAYFTMAIYRYFDSKKYVNYTLNIKSIILFSMIFLCSYISYELNNLFSNIVIFCLTFLYLSIINYHTIKITLKLLKRH